MRTRKKRFASFAFSAFDQELTNARNLKGVSTRRFPTEYLSDADRLHARIDRRPGRVVAFAVQYETMINERWRPVIRVDGTMKERPHQHVFHPNKRAEMKLPLKDDFPSYATVFYSSWRSIRNNYTIYKERFLSQL